MERIAGMSLPTPAKKITFIAFSLILLYFAIQLVRYHYLLVTYPYPLESFEGAMLLTTDLLLDGENPFALDRMPAAMNVYGINYHWVVYPFAKIWGSTFIVHRAVSAFFLLISCILFFVVIRRHGINLVYSISAVLLLYASLLYRYTPLAKPDSVGFFLFLLSVFIVYLMQYSTPSLLISGILGVAAFYAKPYFVLSVPYIALYLFLFISKKKALLYGIVAFLLFLGTAFFVNGIFETYFLNTLFNHVNVATNDIPHLQMQLEFFLIFYSGIFLILLACLLLFVLDKSPDAPWRNLKFETLRNELTKRIDVFRFDKPFITMAFPLSVFCLILSSLLFYFKLGRHHGNIMTYAYHLMTPFFLIYVFKLIDSPLKNPNLVKRRENYGYVLLMPCILLSLYLLYASASYLKDSPEWLASEEWWQIEQITTSHQNIMNSPVIVYLLVEQNKPVYDTGQTEFFQESHYPFEWLDAIFPSNSEISARWDEYEASIRSSVANKEFDAIIMESPEEYSFLQGFEDHYTRTDLLAICIFHTAQCTLLEVWEPK